LLGVAFGLLVGSPIALAQSTSAMGPERILITGSSTMAPLVKALAERFQALTPGPPIVVEAGGSGRGIKDATEGKADIGMASRALVGAESALFSFAIARDGVSVVLHKDNPVAGLTRQQVVGIYTGTITNWKEVGGKDAPIAVMAAGEHYSSTELFTHFFKIKYADIKAHVAVGDNETRFKALAEHPNGIVYVSVGEAERRALAGAPIKLLPMSGVAASTKTIKSGNFPISRPLLLLTKAPPTGRVKQFIDFALSGQAVETITTYDFVPYAD
jgi:phosphate transport system substrate-binding protein